MALITCPECKKEISDTADSCPNCGCKITPEMLAEIKEEQLSQQKIKKVVGIGCGFFIVIILFVMVALFLSVSTEDSSVSPKDSSVKASTPKTQEQIREEQIARYFSGWDGSHQGLTKLIKASMNDVGSYEHVETVYWDKNDHLIVKTTFRGKNAFGGVVKNWVKAKVDLDGNVLEILSQKP
ncbi:MAG: hypothetical protein KAT46_06320 [Deltaproteobacteria bacterium]|nr:hypothetical protein [Deltaproteobacteria bacterium]